MRETEQSHYHDSLVELRARLTNEARHTAEQAVEETGGRGTISNVPTHAAHRDAESLERDTALDDSRQQMIDSIDIALERMRVGNYGLCATCGQEISKDRLELLPFAVQCVGCAERSEEE